MTKFLCLLKVNSLVLTHIRHEEFITVLKEKDRYEMMKNNLRKENGESYEIMRFNSVKSKIWKNKKQQNRNIIKRTLCS